MLSRTFARRVIRLRSARTLGRTSYHVQPLPQAPIEELPALTGFDLLSPPARSTSQPLYTPSPQPTPSSSSPGAAKRHRSPQQRSAPPPLPVAGPSTRSLKFHLTREAQHDAPPLDESVLQAFYRDLVISGTELLKPEDVLGLPSPEDPAGRPGPAERKQVIRGLRQRLLSERSELLGLPSVPGASGSETRELLGLLQMLSGGEAEGLVKGKGKQRLDVRITGGAVTVPSGLVLRSEWDALFQELVQGGDLHGAEALFAIMAAHGVASSDQMRDEVMGAYAKKGKVQDVMRIAGDITNAGKTLQRIHHDHLVTSYLACSPPQAQNAITHLTSFETLKRPLPQSSYALVLRHLAVPAPPGTGISTHVTARTRALAWDLFAHMRLRAHATPTAEVYATMIRACAASSDPQPERARDLWTEMTVDKGKEPGRDEYDAIIWALSATKETYLEAFELLRQMLARHKEATWVPFEDEGEGGGGWSRWVPKMESFAALLEGTKRAGDLTRGRWVLGEMVKLARSLEGVVHGELREKMGKGLGPDENVLSSVFMTYAAWVPPLRKESLKAASKSDDNSTLSGSSMEKEDESSTPSVMAKERREEDSGQSIGEFVDKPETTETYTPSTASDARRELALMIEHVLEHTSPSTAPKSLHTSPFKDIKLTARLVNSYLSAYLTHADVATSRQVWAETWDKVATRGVKPNGWSYLIGLQRCTRRPRHSSEAKERGEQFDWGKQLWADWRVLYDDIMSAPQSGLEIAKVGAGTLSSLEYPSGHPAQIRRLWLLGLGPRQVESVWRNAIRLHALNDDLTTSLSLLTEFAALHPAAEISRAYAPLHPDGLAIRMSTPSTIAEVDVPPHLLFKDVDVLHERLVRDDRVGDLGKVKSVTKGYEAALIKRRKWSVRGMGVGREIKRKKAWEEGKGKVTWGREGPFLVGHRGSGGAVPGDQKLLEEVHARGRPRSGKRLLQPLEEAEDLEPPKLRATG